MSKEWLKRRKRDSYYKKAKREGYRSRAAYKLKEINNRVKLIKPGSRVLDVGASPGGWSQVAMEIVGDRGKVVAVDITPMQPIDGVVFIQGNIEHDDVVERILEESDRYDAVISDAAPKLSGNKTLDRGRSYALCYFALKLSLKVLRDGGDCLVKIFQGDEMDELKDDFADHFGSVDHFKPKSSVKRSIELYLLFRNFKGS